MNSLLVLDELHGKSVENIIKTFAYILSREKGKCLF